MTNLPEWALPIRDEMARAICDHTRELTRYDDLDDYSRKFWLGHATAALAVALPLIADHMAGVAQGFSRFEPDGPYADTGDLIAAAIRQEAKTKNEE